MTSQHCLLISQRKVVKYFFVVVQSLSRFQLFATPCTIARQASLFPTMSQNLLKLVSIESVMLSNNLIFCCPPISFCLQSFPASESFPISWLSTSCGQSIRTPETILSMTIHGWFPLELTGLISCCPRDSQESSPTQQFESINSSTLRLHGPPLTFSHDYADICWQSDVSAF